MAFPTITATVTGNTFSSLNITMPTHGAGDVVMVIIACDNDPTQLANEAQIQGWSAIPESLFATRSQVICWRKVPSGGSVGLNFNGQGNNRELYRCYTITNASTIEGNFTADDNHPGGANPPSETIAVSQRDVLWIATQNEWGDNLVASAAPTNYTNLDTATYPDERLGLSVARRELNATTEDPGIFTISNAGILYYAGTFAVYDVLPEFAAAPAAASTVTAALTIGGTQELATVAAATSTVTPTMVVSGGPLATAISVTSTVTPALTIPRDYATVISAASTVTPFFENNLRFLSSTAITSVVGPTPTITVTRGLVSTTTATSIVLSDFRTDLGFASTTNANSTVTPLLRRTVPLQATVAATSTVTPSVSNGNILIAAKATGQSPGAQTQFTVPLPPHHEGQMLVVFCGFGDNNSPAYDSVGSTAGWRCERQGGNIAGTDVGGAWYYKIAESNSEVLVAESFSVEKFNTVAYAIDDANGYFIRSHNQGLFGATQNPEFRDIALDKARDVISFAVVYGEADSIMTAAPTGYTIDETLQGGTSFDDGSVSVAIKEANVSSEAPSTATMLNNAAHCTTTFIAYRRDELETDFEYRTRFDDSTSYFDTSALDPHVIDNDWQAFGTNQDEGFPNWVTAQDGPSGSGLFTDAFWCLRRIAGYSNVTEGGFIEFQTTWEELGLNNGAYSQITSYDDVEIWYEVQNITGSQSGRPGTATNGVLEIVDPNGTTVLIDAPSTATSNTGWLQLTNNVGAITPYFANEPITLRIYAESIDPLAEGTIHINFEDLRFAVTVDSDPVGTRRFSTSVSANSSVEVGTLRLLPVVIAEATTTIDPASTNAVITLPAHQAGDALVVIYAVENIVEAEVNAGFGGLLSEWELLHTRGDANSTGGAGVVYKIAQSNSETLQLNFSSSSRAVARAYTIAEATVIEAELSRNPPLNPVSGNNEVPRLPSGNNFVERACVRFGAVASVPGMTLTGTWTTAFTNNELIRDINLGAGGSQLIIDYAAIVDQMSIAGMDRTLLTTPLDEEVFFISVAAYNPSLPFFGPFDSDEGSDKRVQRILFTHDDPANIVSSRTEVNGWDISSSSLSVIFDPTQSNGSQIIDRLYAATATISTAGESILVPMTITGTWEDFGVPPNSVITDLRGSTFLWSIFEFPTTPIASFAAFGTDFAGPNEGAMNATTNGTNYKLNNRIEWDAVEPNLSATPVSHTGLSIPSSASVTFTIPFQGAKSLGASGGNVVWGNTNAEIEIVYTIPTRAEISASSTVTANLGVTQQLATNLAATAIVTGNIDETRKLLGTTAVTSVLGPTPTLDVTRNMIAPVSATSLVTANVGLTVFLDSTTNAVAVISPNEFFYGYESVISATSSVTPTLDVSRPINTSIAATSTTAQDVRRTVNWNSVTSAASAVFTQNNGIIVDRPLRADFNGNQVLEANMRLAGKFAGTVNATSSVTPQLDGGRNFISTTNAFSTVQAQTGRGVVVASALVAQSVLGPNPSLAVTRTIEGSLSATSALTITQINRLVEWDTSLAVASTVIGTVVVITNTLELTWTSGEYFYEPEPYVIRLTSDTYDDTVTVNEILNPIQLSDGDVLDPMVINSDDDGPA